MCCVLWLLGAWWVICNLTPSWKDELTVPSVESLGQGRPEQPDPPLKVMVVTKENAAAHAFAKHIEFLQLPPSLEEKFGRLVGATELEKGPASQSKLDILPGSRNNVLRTKQAIIGCGGGFHQECTQPYSPAARWMLEVDIALKMRANSTETWTKPLPLQEFPVKALLYGVGITNKRQGLRKSDEACAFRRKLMRRPIALRGDTKFLPPHMLGAIVHPYARCAWTPRGRTQPATSGKYQATPGINPWECSCFPRAV